MRANMLSVGAYILAILENCFEFMSPTSYTASVNSGGEVDWESLTFMRKVIENKYWNNLIIVFIVLSCIPLMLAR
jgi:hypothetical protein